MNDGTSKTDQSLINEQNQQKQAVDFLHKKEEAHKLLSPHYFTQLK